MKKKFKILSILIISLMLVYPVSTFANDTIKLTKKTYISTGSGNNIVAKFKTNKGYAYCVTPNKSGPSEGTTLKYKETVKNGGVLYLLDKQTGSDSNYVSTQLAIWKYYNNFTKSASSSYVSKRNTLVVNAKKNKNYSTTPTLSVSNSGKTTNMTESGNYFKSQAIKVTGNNLTTSISISVSGAPAGTKIVNSNNKTISTIKTGNVFYILTPVNNVENKITFTVNVNAKGKVSTVKRYTTGNSKQQELVIISKEEKKVTDYTKLTVTPKKRTCTKYNDKYYDKNGNVTDEITYKQQCQTNKCVKVGDKYYDKNGKETTEATYKAQCMNICKIVDGKYYDKDGKETDESTYKSQCVKTCVIDGDKYYDKNGNVTDQITYQQQCEKNTCSKVGDKYYDENGTEVSYEKFLVSCETHTCEIVGNYYFGKNSTIVDKATYTAECTEETHICTNYNDKWYDASGNVTDESTYKAQCTTTEVIVPNTADWTDLLYVLIGLTLIGGTFGVLKLINKYSIKA